MTHPSGLQYSYDDLDLVCCHGVDSEGLWMGSGASKQGRRTRCASMPEGCHQLPTDDMAQILEGTASVVNNDTESKCLKLVKNNEKVALDLQESVHSSHELVGVDAPQRASESEDLETTNAGNSGQFSCNPNSISNANISCATDSISKSEKTIDDESDAGTESSQSHDICIDDNVFKTPHISGEQQQYFSISSNNEPPLSESTGEQPGKCPNHQETKESHTEGCSRPPEISEVTLNRSSAGELEPQTDLPDVEQRKISTSDQASVPGALHSSANAMEGGTAMAPVDKTVEPVLTLVVDGECGKGIGESWSKDSADKLDGLKDSETRNENTGLNDHSRDIQGEKQDHDGCAGVLDQSQTLLEQQNVEMTAVSRPEGEENAHAGGSEKAAHVSHCAFESSDISAKTQYCSLMANGNVSSEQPNTGYLERDPTQTNAAQHGDQNVKTSISPPMENIDQSLSPQELTVLEDADISHQLENSCSKLDTIPEVSLVEVDDTSVVHPQKMNDVNIAKNPAVQDSLLDDKYEATEQHAHNLLPCSTEVDEGLHGNRASGLGCFGESPASEVADGHSEHHRPGATVSRMEESDEAVHSVIYSDTQLASAAVDGTNEPGDQKDDNVVKVRMRKRDHARLDSMVLLLMKLDQLDQEIDNALSATSSMDSTPTLHRRHLLEDLGSLPAASQTTQLPHVAAALSSEPTTALGAKPKSGSTSVVPEKEKGKSLRFYILMCCADESPDTMRVEKNCL